MSYRPDNRRRDPRRGRGGRGAGPGAGRPGVEVVAVDPAIITAQEWATAREFAARDAADLDAEWAALSDADREALACGEDDYDDDGHVIVPPDPCTPEAIDGDDGVDGDSGDGKRDGGSGVEDSDADALDATAGVRWWEAQWLSLAADGAAGATVWELLAAATAEPGSLGVPDRPDQPGSSLHQLQCLDRLTAILAGHRHVRPGHPAPGSRQSVPANGPPLGERSESSRGGNVIPAPVGRALAASVKAWRRIVTDPVTGHLLDYGRRTYLPGPLVEFTKARDGTCAAPYCERPARRCQTDHRRRFPEGPSAAWNCGNFCDLHHPLKTAGWIDATDSDATGAITYRTTWGQEVRTEPHRYLPDPRPPTSETELDDTGPPGPPDDDPDPPF